MLDPVQPLEYETGLFPVVDFKKGLGLGLG